MLRRFEFWFGTFLSLLKGMSQLLYGMWHVSGLPRPIITIFGGSRLKQDDYYAAQATALAQRCVDHNISVLTGGGPGIMEAASCGAVYSKTGTGKTIGIGVKNLKEEHNMCVHDYIQVDQFFARKWLLTRYSSGFIVFPGGFGTLDELTELLTLMQTGFLERVPVVLVGKEYWTPFLTWLTNEGIRHGTIEMHELQLFSLSDNLDEIFTIIHTHCQEKHHMDSR
jgi:uncharacterized protein (TIGR00730 family)